ncbi:MAG: aconitate hydratase B, partial [Methylophilaceae bacterium]|nr:aconitate hydratase B [Methylophilaceae bacterium]
YAHVFEIDLNQIKEPLVACPNDPDDIKPLSAVQNDTIDEVFIGSCMTNIGHYRAAAKVLEGQGAIPTRLWIAPPTRMDEAQLRDEGVYSTFGIAGARTEVPGCSVGDTITPNQGNIYQYLNFNLMDEYKAKKVIGIAQVS